MTRAKRLGRIPSQLESLFAMHIRAEGLPEPVMEYQFAPPRKWRFDFAWPDARSPHGLAVEIEGGTWIKSRHTTGSGFAQDCEKYNAAALAGWCVLRFTGAMVTSGLALETVKKALS